MGKTLPTRLLLALLAAVAGCAGEASTPGSDGERPRADTVAAPPQAGRIYDRAIVFLPLRADSTLMVAWMVNARVRPGVVEREARGWLARGGAWDGFFGDRWETPPTREPWRLLPRGAMRLLVGESDAVERIVFQSGARQLETVLGPTRAEWNGRRGESYRLLDGAALLSNQRVEGLVLDVSRARRPEDPAPGDWVLLASGDSLQLLLAAPESRPQGTAAAYQGWAQLDFREVQWPRVTLSWTERRAFERARRDVPVAWRARSSDGELVAAFEVRSAQLQAGEGEGPLLPVDGLFEVEGTVGLAGVEYPVKGIYRHVQP